jgi:hypothetical protein
MTDIDKLGDKVESLIEKVKNLKFKFQDDALETDAQDAQNEAVAALENWLELVTQDADGRDETQEEEE